MISSVTPTLLMEGVLHDKLCNTTHFWWKVSNIETTLTHVITFN